MTYEVKSRLITTGQLKEKTIGSSYLFTATEARKIATNFIKDCKKGIDPYLTPKPDEEPQIKSYR